LQLLSSIVPVVFTLGPLDFCFLLSVSPWPVGEQRREGAPKSGEEGRWRWGPAGEKQEGLKNYLWLVLGRGETLGGGGSTERDVGSELSRDGGALGS
jgi:hypothetical protein